MTIFIASAICLFVYVCFKFFSEDHDTRFSRECEYLTYISMQGSHYDSTIKKTTNIRKKEKTFEETRDKFLEKIKLKSYVGGKFPYEKFPNSVFWNKDAFNRHRVHASIIKFDYVLYMMSKKDHIKWIEFFNQWNNERKEEWNK